MITYLHWFVGTIRLPIAKDDYDNFVNHIEIARKDIDNMHNIQSYFQTNLMKDMYLMVKQLIQ